MSGTVSFRQAQQNVARKPHAFRERAMQVPFLDDNPMSGPPPCTSQDFELPRLRKCTFDPSTIQFQKKLGGGLDGYVWKVWFGDVGPFALKIFWDTDPPDFHHYYAAQRECQNVAVLQMIDTAIAQAAAESKPVRVHANPCTKFEALDNLFAFCDERRLEEPCPESSETVLLTSMPRVRKCFGWLRISGELFRDLPRRLKVHPYTMSKINRSMSFSKEYIALVYEYVEEGENDQAVVENVDRFCWLTGFAHTLSPAARNWKSGVLVDLADIVYAGGYGWNKVLYHPRTADCILVE